jgi:TRAP-type C4-dicarboxylate transport system permease small subunit
VDLPEARTVSDDLPATAAEPPVRARSLDLHARLTYPDDGPFSAKVRKVDDLVGRVEQVVLVTILAAIVLTGAGHALLEKFAHIRIPFKDDVVRAGTFAIAMIGGAFASHQAKHLSMDLLSRRFSPRNRLFLKVVLGLFAVFVLILLIRSGLHNIENEKQFLQEDKLISRVKVAWLIPIGGALMILHTVLHTIIDIDYLARHKTPPERMRSGH